MPWLVFLSGLSLLTKGSLVVFPVRAHAWVAGQVPSGGTCGRQPHTDISLPLSKTKIFLKTKPLLSPTLYTSGQCHFFLQFSNGAGCFLLYSQGTV